MKTVMASSKHFSFFWYYYGKSIACTNFRNWKIYL